MGWPAMETRGAPRRASSTVQEKNVGRLILVTFAVNQTVNAIIYNF